MTEKTLPIAIAILPIHLLLTSTAWAVQSHGGTEGLVSHQIGHFLFTLGMGYLLYRLYHMHLQGAGWVEFRIFLWLLIIWNIVTFSGHWLNEYVEPGKFLKVNSITLSFAIDSPLDAIYYLTRLDHLVLVPSFVCLLLALRKWGRTQ